MEGEQGQQQLCVPGEKVVGHLTSQNYTVVLGRYAMPMHAHNNRFRINDCILAVCTKAWMNEQARKDPPMCKPILVHYGAVFFSTFIELLLVHAGLFFTPCPLRT